MAFVFSRWNVNFGDEMKCEHTLTIDNFEFTQLVSFSLVVLLLNYFHGTTHQLQIALLFCCVDQMNRLQNRARLINQKTKIVIDGEVPRTTTTKTASIPLVSSSTLGILVWNTLQRPSEYEDCDRRRSPADDDAENSIHTTGLFLHIRNLGLKYTTETQMFLEHFSEGGFDLIRGHSSFSWTSYDHS